MLAAPSSAEWKGGLSRAHPAAGTAGLLLRTEQRFSEKKNEVDQQEEEEEDLCEEDVWGWASHHDPEDEPSSVAVPTAPPPPSSSSAARVLHRSGIRRPGAAATSVMRVAAASASTARTHEHTARSTPVTVPEWCKVRGGAGAAVMASDCDEDSDEERVPPHEVLAREYAQSHMMMSMSMLQGAGRTLKGRDMSRVRNAVLKSTGFLT